LRLAELGQRGVGEFAALFGRAFRIARSRVRGALRSFDARQRVADLPLELGESRGVASRELCLRRAGRLLVADAAALAAIDTPDREPPRTECGS
jgi:hypothetical protein